VTPSEIEPATFLPEGSLNNSESGQKNFSVPLPTAKVPNRPLNWTLVVPKGRSGCAQ
jgi:hypothetical protein